MSASEPGPRFHIHTISLASLVERWACSAISIAVVVLLSDGHELKGLYDSKSF
jgi:uncharacterized protein with von Willebrand factor type A (vWA) domain